MADISKITIPNGNSTATYNLKDNAALHTVTPSTKSIGSASAGTAIAADDITAYTAGTAASLSYTSRSIPNVTSVGSRTITNLSFSATDRDNGVSTTDYKMIMPYNIVTAVTVPTLGTAISADDITAWTTNTPTSVTYTARSIPNISVSSQTVVTGITAS